VVQSKNGTRREAGFAATNRLRDLHPKDFKRLLDEEYEARGIPVKKSPEDKARNQLRELATRYPAIAMEVTRGLFGFDEDPTLPEDNAEKV
jgi:hypothetical protein